MHSSACTAHRGCGSRRESTLNPALSNAATISVKGLCQNCTSNSFATLGPTIPQQLDVEIIAASRPFDVLHRMASRD